MKASHSEINIWENLNSLICLQIIGEGRTSLVEGLLGCNYEECKQKYLHALKNLALKDTVPVLLQHAVFGSKKTSVTALRALWSLLSDSWDEDVKRAAHRYITGWEDLIPVPELWLQIFCWSLDQVTGLLEVFSYLWLQEQTQPMRKVKEMPSGVLCIWLLVIWLYSRVRKLTDLYTEYQTENMST